MRRAIQTYCIVYGCLASALAFVWFLSALAGKFDEDVSFTVVIGLFLLHGLAAFLSFQHYSRRWEPVIPLTPSRIRWAKVAFAAGTLNILGCFAIFIGVAEMKNQILAGGMVYLVFTSLVLQNTIYIAIHWLFRPENIFPKWFIELVTNPLSFLLYK